MSKIVGPKVYHKNFNNYQSRQGETEKQQRKHVIFPSDAVDSRKSKDHKKNLVSFYLKAPQKSGKA